MNKLDELEKYRKTILLSEIGVLIHDIGKLSKKFVKDKSEDEKLENDDWHHSEILSDDEHDISKKVPDIKNGEVILEDFIKYHHTKQWDDDFDNKYGSNLPVFFKFLPASDCFDSEEDKGGRDQQKFEETYISNAFGKEKEKVKVDSLDSLREECYKAIKDYSENDFEKDTNDVCDKRKKFQEDIKNKFKKTLGETRRASNDVLLWEHAYMSATIFKALHNQYILSDSNEFREEVDDIKYQGNGKFKDQNDDHDNINIIDIIKENNPFKILSIGWDYFEFLSQSQKISDITGRVKAIDGIKKKLRKEIEVEFLLGNMIYEDENGIHFLIPASFDDKEQVRGKILDIFNELVDGILLPKIRYSDEGAFLKEILPNAIENVMKVDKSLISELEWFSIKEKKEKSENRGDKNILICNNCGKGVYIEGKKPEICDTCEKKLRDNKTDRKQTKIVDEIAWNGSEYGKLALFTLSFKLKNWVNGDNIQSIYFGNIEKYNLNNTGLAGRLKNIIDKKIGPKISNNKTIHDINFNKEIDNFDKYIVKKNKLKEELSNLEMNLIGKNADLQKKRSAIQNLRDILKKYNCWVLDEENPKNPSPSRLMRVWNNTNEFFSKFGEEITDNIGKEDMTITRTCFDFNNSIVSKWSDSGIVEIRVKKSENDEEPEFEKIECIVNNEDDQVEIIDPKVNSIIKKEQKYIEIKKKNQTSYLVLGEKNLKETNRTIVPYRELSKSPTQFMFLAPVEKTEDIIGAIKNLYKNQLGKVYGKLPLNVGIVFGKKKTPMFSMIDSARRFRENYDNELNKKNEFDVVSTNGNDDKITLELKKDEEESFTYEIDIPNKLGNGETDFYHPYLKVKDGEDVLEIELGEEGESSNSITQKDINKISQKEGDTVILDEANFDFEYLDTNKRRFDISLNDEGSRSHDIVEKDEPRPYLFEDLQKFTKLKKIFKTIGCWTPIRDIESIAGDKRVEWTDGRDEFDDEEKQAYREFIQNVLENKISETVKNNLEWRKDGFEDKSFVVECIMDGTYFDAVELYKTIMDIDLEDEKDE